MNTQTAWVITGVAVIGAAFLFLATEDSRMHGRAAPVDQRFIEEMIPHHQGAIEMAKVALEKSTKPEILTLSRQIIDAQTKEINDMRTWYQNWFGTSVPEGGGMMHGMAEQVHMQGMVGDIEKLNTAPDFDMEFLSQMIVHHEMAIVMARMLVESTEREEMRTLAGTILTTQQQEIESMRAWIKGWYDDSN